MRFLKKVGSLIVAGSRLILGISTQVQRVLPDGRIETVTDKLLEIQDVIIKAEVFGQTLSLIGADKLKAAGPAVAQVILGSALMADRKISRPELFSSGASKIADGMADVLNSLKDDIETEDHD